MARIRAKRASPFAIPSYETDDEIAALPEAEMN